MSLEMMIFHLEEPENVEPVFKDFSTSSSSFVNFQVPTLGAYEVVHAEVEGFKLVNNGLVRNLTIDGKNVIVASDSLFPNPFSGLLKVFYSGVRDYALFFPYLSEEKKAAVLGEFLHEAKTAYKNNNPLSFTLMAASVCEGVLTEFFKKHKFHQLINAVEESGFMDKNECLNLHRLRDMRNKVHPDKMLKEDPATRKDMVELNAFLDKFLIKRWDKLKL